jgi:hypothetical protein
MSHPFDRAWKDEWLRGLLVAYGARRDGTAEDAYRVYLGLTGESRRKADEYVKLYLPVKTAKAGEEQLSDRGDPGDLQNRAELDLQARPVV